MPTREIDGAEFGPFRSELLLGAVVLALCTDQTLHVQNFRVQRSLPGLTQREVEKLQILSDECDGQLDRVRLGSTDFQISGRAGYLRNWVRWVHYPHVHGPRAAYYLTLLASQSVVPASFMLTAPSVLPASVTAEYIELVVLASLAKRGIQATIKNPIIGRFPNVGLTSTHVAPSVLSGFDLLEKGKFDRLDVTVSCNGHRPSRYRRFIESVCRELHPMEVCFSHRIKEGSDAQLSATLIARYENSIVGFCEVQSGERSPDQVAIDLVQKFKAWASSNQILDPLAPHYLFPAIYLSQEASQVRLPEGDWEPYVRLYNDLTQRQATLSDGRLSVPSTDSIYAAA